MDIAPVRFEPDDGSEQVTQALRGEPLTVEGRRDGWAHVRTAYDYPGWIREELLKPGSDPVSTWLGPDRDGEPVKEARQFLGAPYEWGGMTERGIDCSGLVHMSYRCLGKLIPRDADQQEEAGEDVSEDNLRPGDLVCYEGHIAFWLGDGRILHATERDDVDGVVEEPEPAQYREIFHKYVRL